MSASLKQEASELHADPYLDACAKFRGIEARRWIFRDENGDFVHDHWKALDAESSPLLDVICDTVVSCDAMRAKARAQAFIAAECDIPDVPITDVGRRIIDAMVRDALGG